MAEFRYPLNDLDSPDELLGLLGSFWATTYQGNDLVQSIVATTGRMAQQTHRQFMELLYSVSRYTVPLYHEESWTPLRIRESDINVAAEIPVKYQTDAEYAYTSGTHLTYGQKSTQLRYSVTRPDGLEHARVIFNRLAFPSVQLTCGLDFSVREKLITFRENPFHNDLIPVREILGDNGRVVDRECVLWIYQGEWDWETVYEQFGYALNLRLKTSEGYRDFINAIFDSFSRGTSLKTQQQALAAAFGVPLVVEVREIVEEITTDRNGLVIITNQHVYRFPHGVTAIVSPGDVLSAGDPLTDLLRIFELNRGDPLPAETIQALTIGPGVLHPKFKEELTFDNREVPLQTEMSQGHLKVSWELGGFPDDVDAFWNHVHAEGVRRDRTLAMLLDTRESPEEPPSAMNLPAKINPMQFLTQNLLRNNAYIVKIRQGNHQKQRLPFVPAEHLRKIQPPHTLMLLVVELVYRESPVIMDGPGDAVSPGYTESISGFPAMAASEVISMPGYVTEKVRLQSADDLCAE